MATIAVPPVTKTTLDVGLVRAARALYSENPSHAPGSEWPSPGTFCVVTAFQRAGASVWSGYRWAFRDAAGGVADLVEWNATHTTEEVLEVWDRIIARLEAEAA